MSETYCSVIPCQGIPVTYCLYEKLFNKKKKTDSLVAFALVRHYPNGMADLWHVQANKKGKGYGKQILEEVKSHCWQLLTQWDASTEEGRKACLAVGMERFYQGDMELLRWVDDKEGAEEQAKKYYIATLDYLATGLNAEIVIGSGKKGVLITAPETEKKEEMDLKDAKEFDNAEDYIQDIQKEIKDGKQTSSASSGITRKDFQKEEKSGKISSGKKKKEKKDSSPKSQGDSKEKKEGSGNG